MANKVTENKPEPVDPFSGQLELMFIDPKKDVLTAQAVIGPAPMSFYHQKIIKDLVEQAMKRIEPEIHEMQGYEVLKYSIVIKQHKSKLST